MAALWLSAMTYADSGRTAEATKMLPELVEQDPRISSEDAAARLLDSSVQALRDIRVAYGQSETCS